jgi:hypothetical protein
MPIDAPRTAKPSQHFTPFRSAAEEAMNTLEQEPSENEGGRMSSTSGQTVRTSDAELPYKAILKHDGRADSSHSFKTMREAEAFIRRNTPPPAPHCTLYDRPAEDDLTLTVITEVHR